MYVISFDIIALFASIILLAVHFVLFDNTQKVHKLFQIFLILTAVESSFDILTARIIDGNIMLSDPVCMLLNSLYFASTFFTAYVGYRLLSYRFEYTNLHTKASSDVIVCLGLILLIINAFTGVFFEFEQGKYIKNELFVIVNMPSFLLLGLILIFIIVYRLKRKSGNMIVPAFFVLIELTTFIIQLAFPDLLLTCIGKAMAGVGFCLYLDLPEHLKLIDAVDRLRESQFKQVSRIEELNEAVKLKNEFLIKMSHELKTPINAILGFGEIIQTESEEKDVREEAGNLIQCGDELLSIVNRIVDFAQLETGRLELNEIEYDIVGAYLAVHNKLVKICSNTEFTLEHNFSEEIPKRLYGDTDKINIILEELAKLFSLEMEEGIFKWDVLLNRIEHNIVYIEISIRCDGSRKKNLNSQKKENFNYTILEKLTECMKGKLSYPEKEGDAISFVFPQEIVDLKPIGDLETAVAAYSEKKKYEENGVNFIMPEAEILAVDDLEINLEILEGILEPYCLRFTKALSGEEALEIMKNKCFDFVFMDIMMDGIDGVETLRRIRSEKGILSPDIPVVALTANSFLGARDKYLADGFVDYIPKPIKRSKLAEALRKYVPNKVQTEWAEMNIAYVDTELADAVKNDMVISKNTDKTDSKKIQSFDDISGLNYKVGFTLCGEDEKLYKEVLKEFCYDNSSEKLVDSFEKEDWDNYRIVIHGLKSTSKTVGLSDLSESAKALEMAAKDGDIAYINDNHNAWLESYKEIVMNIRELL